MTTETTPRRYYIHRHAKSGKPMNDPRLFYYYGDAFYYIPETPHVTIAQVCIVDPDYLTALEAVYKAAYSLVDGGAIKDKDTAEVYASEFMTLTKAIDDAECARNRITTQATPAVTGEEKE